MSAEAATEFDDKTKELGDKIVGLTLLEAKRVVDYLKQVHGIEPAGGGAVPLLVGIVAAAVVSWLAIAWLLRFLQNHSTWWFVGYRLFFGVGLLIWVGHHPG